MKRTLLVLVVVLSAFIGAIVGILFAVRYLDITPTYVSIDAHQKSVGVGYRVDTSKVHGPPSLNFEEAARRITPAVVHIRTIYGPGNFSLNPLERTPGTDTQSTGSGVIISDDGFIVTNNHVIEDANSIEVVMQNNQRFFAKVIGTDPTSDLALIKVKAKGLPFVRYGDSDVLVPGQWVLAIGNPFDLNSTVTAGIVSAKARNIGILHDRNNLQIESFIQTDAAVNPGNSGGALVNLNGELIGINSAIATATGTYSGYSFAIPVSLVKKVMDDLLEFGEVQRGLLGIRIGDVNASIAERQHLDVVRGVYVSDVNKGGAAEEAGLESGDVITAINEHPVTTMSELQEWVARNRPGQYVKVTYRRDGGEFNVKARLKNREGSELLTRKKDEYEFGGASFENVEYKDLNHLNLDGGVRVAKLEAGRWKKGGMKADFIITHIDKTPVDNVTDLNQVLEQKNGAILVEGVYRDGTRGIYGVDWEK